MTTKDRLNYLTTLLVEREVDLEATTDWLADLSLAQFRSTSAILYKALVKIQKMALPSNRQIVLLNLFHRTIVQLNQQFIRDNLMQSLINYAGNLRYNRYLDCLQLQYAKFAFQLLMHHPKHLTIEESARLNHHAMSQLGALLLRHAQLYIAPAKGVWQLVHRLYLYAKREQLLRVDVVEVSSTGVTYTTLEQLYKRILLLALANTEQLQPQDMEKLYNIASQWVDSLHVDTDLPQPYKVYFDSDLPPCFDLESPSKSSHEWSYIQFDNLIQVLQQLQQDQATAKSKIKQGLAEHVLAHLLKLWTLRPQRKFRREAQTGTLEVCLGLAAVHYFVNHEQDWVKAPQITQSKPEPKSNNFTLLLQAHQQEFKPGALNNLAEETDAWQFNRKLASTESDIIVEKRRHLTHQWQIINSSAQGYCLALSDVPPDSLQVGKIIGLKTGKYWYIGVIRWLQATLDKANLRVGIELLAPTAKGVALKTTQQAQAFHGLVITNAQGQQNLITPALLFKEGDALTVQEHGNYNSVKLTKMLAQNYNFAQFEFHYQSK